MLLFTFTTLAFYSISKNGNPHFKLFQYVTKTSKWYSSGFKSTILVFKYCQAELGHFNEKIIVEQFYKSLFLYLINQVRRAARGKGRRSLLPFFENRKMKPDFERKKALVVFIFGSNFPFKI